MVSEDLVWLMAYVSVVAIRLHPRNDSDDAAVDVEEARSFARVAAKFALLDFRDRAPLFT